MKTFTHAQKATEVRLSDLDHPLDQMQLHAMC